MTDTPEQAAARQRLVVIADPGELAAGIRRQQDDLEVVATDSFLSGIPLAAEPGVRGVLAGVQEAGPRRLDAAVAALRAAADRNVPVILCCPPYAEPIARRLMSAGADDYVIYPPLPEDIEAALAVTTRSRDTEAGGVSPPAETVSPEELTGLADAFAHLHAGLGEVLDQLAELIRRSLGADSVEITAYGQTARAGAPVSSPRLIESLTNDDEQIGQLVLGPRCDGGYDATHLEKFRHYVRLFSGILSAHRRESTARDQSLTDPPSGLRNRRYLNQFLPEVIARAGRERFRVTLLMFDIDNFKYYNDTYGHVAGDEIIREVGQLMQRCCRAHDMVVRFGGDEYAVVFWDADEPRVAGSEHLTDPLTVVDRFRDALLTHPFESLGPDARGRLTISGGLATYPWEAGNARELIRRADAALIAAKRQGKNRILPIGGGWIGSGPEQPTGRDPAAAAHRPNTPDTAAGKAEAAAEEA